MKGEMTLAQAHELVLNQMEKERTFHKNRLTRLNELIADVYCKRPPIDHTLTKELRRGLVEGVFTK